jgi:hypothetical protein
VSNRLSVHLIHHYCCDAVIGLISAAIVFGANAAAADAAGCSCATSARGGPPRRARTSGPSGTGVRTSPRFVPRFPFLLHFSPIHPLFSIKIRFGFQQIIPNSIPAAAAQRALGLACLLRAGVQIRRRLSVSLSRLFSPPGHPSLRTCKQVAERLIYHVFSRLIHDVLCRLMHDVLCRFMHLWSWMFSTQASCRRVESAAATD